MNLNHICLTVKRAAESRDWYVGSLGLKLEHEDPKSGFVGLEDHGGFGLLLQQGDLKTDPAAILSIYFEVENVDDLHRELAAKGSRFEHPPKQTGWGYGPEIKDPNGYVIRFFDSRSKS